MTRVYVSGPMSGLPESNFPAFHAAAAELRRLGYEVVNPAEINPCDPPPPDAGEAEFKAFWRQCLRADVRELCDCDMLALLPGWEDSSGAHLEVHIAHRLGIRVRALHSLLLDQFEPEVATRCDGCAELRDQLREKAAWCDELERDAERYRFVRTADKVGISAEAARDPVAYDAAIDRAMERAKL